MHHGNTTIRGTLIGAAGSGGSSGSTAISQCEAQQREIPREMGLLRDQLDTLEVVAESLLQQLGPVLVSYPQPPDSNELKQSISTSLGGEIDAVRRRALILTQRLSAAASGLAV